MANRVLLGALPGGGFGLRVSKPGVNVLTAGADALLFDSDMEMVQIVQSGSFTDGPGTWTRAVSIPNLGFQPFIAFGTSAGQIHVTYNSNTSLTFGGGSMPSGVTASWVYAVLSIPRG